MEGNRDEVWHVTEDKDWLQYHLNGSFDTFRRKMWDIHYEVLMERDYWRRQAYFASGVAAIFGATLIFLCLS